MRQSPLFRVYEQKGFSLIELMIVVGIIAILTLMAVPRFGKMTARARQSEARTNLSAIYTLQETYFADNTRYCCNGSGGTNLANYGFQGAGAAPSCTNNELGFSIRPCLPDKIRYTYSNNGGANAFTATATTGTGDNNLVLPGCTQPDTWTIDQEKDLKSSSNSVKLCD